MVRQALSHETPDSIGLTQAKTIRLVSAESPLNLELGGRLGPVDVEYETYGVLAERKDNVVFVAHALSGDAHAAGWDRDALGTGRTWRTRKPGWWDAVIGPGKAIDTERFFVICPNVLGSCYGTTDNIHPFTLQDLLDWVEAAGVRIVSGHSFSEGSVRTLRPEDNLHAEEVLVVVKRK